MASNQRFVFIAEWFDQPANIVRQYHLIYNLNDTTIELVILKDQIIIQNYFQQHEIKLKKIILKKTQIASITLKDLYIGSTLNIYSKHCRIVDYADVFTRNYFEQKRQKTFALIKPDSYQHIGKIITEIENQGFMITSLKMTRLQENEAMQLFPNNQKPPQLYQQEIKFLSSDYVVGIELVEEDCIQKFLQFIGPEDPSTGKSGLRAKYGQNIIQNSLHGSRCIDAANHEIDYFFSKSFIKSKGILNNCTCAIIKPHIVFRKQIGKIIDRILMEGFEISAMQMLNLDKPSAEEFLEIYKGVVSQFNETVDAMVIGPSIALEIRQENAVNSFRKLCGPYDPELIIKYWDFYIHIFINRICKQIRKNTIRAQFGEDITMNAIHCTDLEEDGVLECEYFFKK